MKMIETPRLMLRNFLLKDAADLFAYWRNPTVNCFQSEKLGSLAEAQAEVAKKLNDDQAIAVCLKSSGQLVGNLFCMKEEPDTYSVGWHFNSRFHGQGLATEATWALFDHLFTDQAARRIYAYVEVDNLASQKLCVRLGMRQEGVFKEYVSFVNDAEGNPKYEDTIQYAVLKREWVLRQPLSNVSTR